MASRKVRLLLGAALAWSASASTFNYDNITSCADARRAPTPRDQCAVAKSEDCGNHYAATYYCATSGPTRGVAIVAFVGWLALLFALLGSTADEYFSPALEQLSADAGLPPRFAGVTLLALGNGAPDVSSTIHAVAGSPDGYRLALGALTGAGMFVGTCVAGAVMVVADGAKAKGALLRDVSAYLITAAVVGYVVGVRQRVTAGTVALLLGGYGAFVAIVLAADLWHRRPGGPYERLLEERRASEEPPAVEILLTLLHDVRRHGPARAADGDGDEEKSPATPTRNPFHDDPDLASPLGRGRGASDPVVIDGGGDALELGASPLDDAFGAALLGEDAEARSEELRGVLVLDLVDRARGHVEELWALPNGPGKLAAFLELPFTAARRASVPLTASDAYGRAPLALSLLGAPLWLCFYASRRGAKHIFAARVFPPSTFFLATVVGAAAAAAAAKLTAGRSTLPPAPAAVLALCGFFVAATWIDVFADELVTTLEFFGVLLGVPDPVLGLTVLAWGNSVGDLSTNLAMAKKGLANMALTACFAGPVFNMLVGLGVGFATRLKEAEGGLIDVRLDAGLKVGFAMILLNTALVVATGVVTRGSIPRQFGFLSLSLYVVYMVLSLAILFSADD